MLLGNDPFAFTSKEDLVFTLRTCINEIEGCLSETAFRELGKITFSEFALVINGSVTGVRSTKNLNPSIEDLNQHQKIQKTGHFTLGKKIIVRKEIFIISTR